MSSRRHQILDAVRPGNVAFPAATSQRFGAESSASGVAIARRTTVLASAVAVLLALHLVGAPLDGPLFNTVACAAILLFGLPHGALDLEIIKRERGTGRLGLGAMLLLYVGMAAAMAAVWRLAPVAALAIFMIMAVVHFAEDWQEVGSTFLNQGLAIALLAAPTLVHRTELEHLFIALSGRNEAALVADVMLLVAPMSVAVAGVTVWTLWRTGFHDQAAAGVLMVVAMIMLPPLVGFALFFCLYHSPRHLGMALSRVARPKGSSPASPPNTKLVVPLVTLAALGIAVALFAGELRADLPARAVAASFMTLSLLTVPHMIVPAVVDLLALRRTRASDGHGRTPI